MGENLIGLIVVVCVVIGAVFLFLSKKQKDQKEAEERAQRTRALEVALSSTSPADASAIAALERVARTQALALQNSIPAPRTPEPAAPIPAAPPAPQATPPSAPAPVEVKPAPLPISFPPPQPDLSNAPPGYPTHAPEGYAYFYPIGGDGKPAGAPMLYFRGNTFPDVAAIDAWLVAVGKSNAALAQWAVDFNTPGSPEWPIITKAQEDEILALFDAEPSEAVRFYNLSNPEYRALLSRWTETLGNQARTALRNKINQYNGGATPDGWAGSAVSKIR